MPASFYDHLERRTAHERARRLSRTRVASVPGAHGALYTSLRTGLLQMGDQLDEGRLVPMFTFSRNAVRDALRLLADEGVVSRQPRNGTVVIAKSAEVPLNVALGWDEAVYPRRQVTVTDNRWVPSTPMTRRYLRTRQRRVHVTEAIDRSDGQPAMLYTRFTLQGQERPLVASPASNGDFRALFEKTYGTRLAAIDSWVEATGADEWAAARLEVAPGTLLLVKSRVLQGVDGLPREYSISHYLASVASFSAAIDSGGTAPAAQPQPAACPAPASSLGEEVLPLGRARSSTDLHTQLRAAIREGVYRTGDRFDEDGLAEEFGASRNAVRRALAQLAAEGIITRNRRQGTVVTASIADYTLNEGTSLQPDELPRYAEEELASHLIPTPPFIADLLQTDHTSVRLDEYVISRDGTPKTLYLRYTAADVDRRPLTCANGEDFQDLFIRAYGVPVGRVTHNVHALRAGGQIARRLGLPADAPVLLAERLICDRDGRPREFSHVYHVAADASLTSRHELRVEPVASRRLDTPHAC